MSRRRRMTERIMLTLMQGAVACVAGCALWIVATVLVRGLPALTWEMVSQLPRGGFYLGKGGGILNAIVGSLMLAGSATIASTLISLPMAFALQRDYLPRWAVRIVTLALDILWGTPSIVYGAFGFVIMMSCGIAASLLGGIIALTFLMIPIMVRAMSEVIAAAPRELKEAAYAIGATRFETMRRVLLRQTLPGLVTAVLLAFGRGIGDAAAVLFTAGYSDRIPRALTDPAASLPLAVFFQLGTPIAAVQQRAHASACILLLIVLAVSVLARAFSARARRFTIR